MQIAVLSLILLLLTTLTLAGPIYTHNDAVRRLNQPPKRYVVVNTIRTSQEGRRRRHAPTDPGDQSRAAETNSIAEPSTAPTGNGSEDGRVPAVGVGAGNTSDLSFLTQTAAATPSAPGATESLDTITTTIAAAAPSATGASSNSETPSTSKGSENGKVPAVGVGAGNTSDLSFLTQAATSTTADASVVSETTVTTTVSASDADITAIATQNGTDLVTTNTIGSGIVSETSPSPSPATVTGISGAPQPTVEPAPGTAAASTVASDDSNASSAKGTGTAIVPPTQGASDFTSTTTVRAQTTVFTTIDVTAEITAAATTTSSNVNRASAAETTQPSTQQNQQSTNFSQTNITETETPSSSPSSPLASVTVVFVTASPTTTRLTAEITTITPGLGTIGVAQTALSESGTTSTIVAGIVTDSSSTSSSAAPRESNNQSAPGPLPTGTNVPSEEPRPSTLSTASPIPDANSLRTRPVQPSGIEGKGQHGPTATSQDPVAVVPVTPGSTPSPVVTQAQAQGPEPATVTEIITETVTTTDHRGRYIQNHVPGQHDSSHFKPELYLGVTFLRQAGALRLTDSFAGQGAVDGVPVLLRRFDVRARDDDGFARNRQGHREGLPPDNNDGDSGGAGAGAGGAVVGTGHVRDRTVKDEL
ncbi:hypothetical protein RBB50_012226 [Rhinocladiella similis]